MFAIQQAARRAPRLVNLSVTAKRTYIGTPPEVRIPLAEKIALGFIFYAGILAVPLYISANIKNYRK